ncbi:hypothetical protein [Halorubrum sp. N11]|uniref:hypothetical protein n=1 Tax=Halorubrum sp. N11 TaxID=3402276 RepID=UPI003EBAB440
MTERGDSRATDDDRRDLENGADAERETNSEPDDGTAHLNDIEDGAGCTEIWERLSERREE